VCLCEVIRAANTHTHTHTHTHTQALKAPPSVPEAAAHLHLKGDTQDNMFLFTLKKGHF